MTLASDFAAYGGAVKAITTGASTLLDGTAGLLGEAIPTGITQITIIPTATGITFAFGTADANSAPIGTNGIMLQAGDIVGFKALQFYSAAAKTAAVVLGSNGFRAIPG